jgi:hypothetical protein
LFVYLSADGRGAVNSRIVGIDTTPTLAGGGVRSEGERGARCSGEDDGCVQDGAQRRFDPLRVFPGHENPTDTKEQSRVLGCGTDAITLREATYIMMQARKGSSQVEMVDKKNTHDMTFFVRRAGYSLAQAGIRMAHSSCTAQEANQTTCEFNARVMVSLMLAWKQFARDSSRLDTPTTVLSAASRGCITRVS